MIKTPAQRAGLSILGLLLGLFLVVKWVQNPATISYPQAGAGDRAVELKKTVDPNSADESMLSSIPGLSKTLAKSIIEYREKRLEDHPGEAPFKTPQDLEPVKGIGPATIHKIEPYLQFP
jgi:DNA uptake protein ComE-like DNA-binding protein